MSLQIKSCFIPSQFLIHKFWCLCKCKPGSNHPSGADWSKEHCLFSWDNYLEQFFFTKPCFQNQIALEQTITRHHDSSPVNIWIEKCVPLFLKVNEILFASSDTYSTLFGNQHMRYPVSAYLSIFLFFCNDIRNSTICSIHFVRNIR